ncbi:uncharacterized protein [Nicotiana sylvestris]|uniref:uncharacterized protein n=1 Tax=Nicotiana sylvestris TaxID=4096 RepID=UPI00388CAA49
MLHHYLKKKIQDLWNTAEDFSLIDLGEDYYIIKFKKKENMDKAIHLGPWFISGHFLSISRWKPNFLAKNEKLTTSAVWIRLPQFPTEFYDGKILEKIGNAIGRILKNDIYTSTTLRGRYARICVEIPLEVLVQPYLFVGQHKQHIHCEGEDFLCKNCGRFGHTMRQCSFIKNQCTETTHVRQAHQPMDTNEGKVDEWITVSFNKKKNQGRKLPTQPSINQVKSNHGPGISVKLFNANTGKYLDKQLLQYQAKIHPSPNQPSKATDQPNNPKEQNNYPSKNHYMDNQQMVLPKPTMENNIFFCNNKFTHLNDDLAL